MTTLVNFIGAASAGKSILAADCYAYFNKQGKTAYLVPEYVKTWALQGFPVNEYREIKILGEQLTLEEAAYHKYDFLFSESPLEMISFYSNFYSNGRLDPVDLIKTLRRNSQAQGLNLVNYFLEINPEWFSTTGRYETLEQALERETLMRDYLVEHKIPFTCLPYNRNPAHILAQLCP